MCIYIYIPFMFPSYHLYRDHYHPQQKPVDHSRFPTKSASQRDGDADIAHLRRRVSIPPCGGRRARPGRGLWPLRGQPYTKNQRKMWEVYGKNWDFMSF